MRAVQYREVGGRPEVVEVPDPEVGPGQVLLRVTAAGLCHSDEFIMSQPAEALGFELPLTLGHEGAGRVEAVGSGVLHTAVGDDVVVYGPWGCGRCVTCARGQENYCRNAVAERILPPGLGAPGAMAELMLVDSERHLVPLGDLDPVAAVPLTDAGLTPYHAIKKVLPALLPGSTAVVIGAGGLGHLGIQLLRALSPATVVAVDLDDGALELARTVGAQHTLRSDDAAADAIRDLTSGVGAAVVLDFVGAQPTLDLAGACAATEGEIVIVGIGGGQLPVGFGTTAYDVAVRAPYWGSRSELVEVLDLARTGAIATHVESYSLDEAPAAYERLHAGKVRGRAVVVPGR